MTLHALLDSVFTWCAQQVCVIPTMVEDTLFDDTYGKDWVLDVYMDSSSYTIVPVMRQSKYFPHLPCTLGVVGTWEALGGVWLEQNALQGRI